MDLVSRCLFAKPWPFVEPKVTLSVGKFSVEKIGELGQCWAKVVDLRHPGINFVASAGLLVNDRKSLDKEEEIKEVDIGGLRQVTKSFSDGTDPDLDPKFKRGDDVTVIKRTTWTIPQPDAPKYRKGLMEGTERGHQRLG